jgi:hypothetical protein
MWPGGPVHQIGFSYRPARAGNRFLGFFEGLKITALWDFFTGNNLFQAEHVSDHLRKLFPGVGSIK